jgi:CheY-like chemotaxis protein
MVLGDEHELVLVDNGADAIKLIDERQDFDLILSDIYMAGTDGVALYRHVQKTHPALARRFVFSSGGTVTERHTDFLITVDPPQLEKPVMVDDLEALIFEYIDLVLP